MTGLDALDVDTQPQLPHHELAQPKQRIGRLCTRRTTDRWVARAWTGSCPEAWTRSSWVGIGHETCNLAVHGKIDWPVVEAK